MNKKCHWTLATHLMGEGPWRLRGLALRLGSIMPDVLVYTYWTGHYYDTTAKRVERNLNALKENGTWTMANCFRLGYNLHFLEDYFTYPHNSHFEGGFIAHCWYEHRLSREMGRRLKNAVPVESGSAGHGAIRATLGERHAAYMNDVPSPENDAAYIISAAEAVSQEIFAAFSRRSVTPRSRAFMQRVGVGV